MGYRYGEGIAIPTTKGAARGTDAEAKRLLLAPEKAHTVKMFSLAQPGVDVHA